MAVGLLMRSLLGTIIDFAFDVEERWLLSIDHPTSFARSDGQHDPVLRLRFAPLIGLPRRRRANPLYQHRPGRIYSPGLLDCFRLCGRNDTGPLRVWSAHRVVAFGTTLNKYLICHGNSFSSVIF